VFRSSYYASISFAQWLAHLPPELVQAHFNFSSDTIKAMSKGDARVVVGG
jgi:oxalate decarboxylase/phosphoglucose isomerase-like protein (cupin superfamily)